MKLIIQPDDGVAPLLSAIKSAKKTIDIAIFRADRKDVETALNAAAARGVKVTALIASANRGGTDSLRKLELRFLEAGITVARSADDLIRYHDKFIVIDQRVLYVLSFNFTHVDIDRSRGFGIITTKNAWLHEGLKLFQADCTRTPYNAGMETFVVSPANSRKSLGTFLKRAKTELLMYDPKISDKEMLRILQDRAKAGVEIRVIGKVAGGYKFDSHKLGKLRLHTRTFIRDRRQAFIGSQSLRTAELDSRRELGLIVYDAKVVKRLVDAFESDWGPPAASEETVTSQVSEVRDEPSHAGATETEMVVEEQKDQTEEQTEIVVETLKEGLEPLAATVKKAVRKAVTMVGEDVIKDEDVKDTMKKVVKKAVKNAVNEAVRDQADH